jgi:hypothetical protein
LCPTSKREYRLRERVLQRIYEITSCPFLNSEGRANEANFAAASRNAPCHAGINGQLQNDRFETTLGSEGKCQRPRANRRANVPAGERYLARHQMRVTGARSSAMRWKLEAQSRQRRVICSLPFRRYLRLSISGKVPSRVRSLRLFVSRISSVQRSPPSPCGNGATQTPRHADEGDESHDHGKRNDHCLGLRQFSSFSSIFGFPDPSILTFRLEVLSVPYMGGSRLLGLVDCAGVPGFVCFSRTCSS